MRSVLLLLRCLPCACPCPRPQALSKLAPHIQQVDMESNGKGVDTNGVRLPFEAGEIDFGERQGQQQQW